MPLEMREWLQRTWRKIAERIPGTRFNHEFWVRCAPRRSTYPACRAVIAARRQDPGFDPAMTGAIQRAYYLQARNPSDRDTLIEVAREIGANTSAFAQALDSSETNTELQREIEKVRMMDSWRFPSLVLDLEGSVRQVPVDYMSAEAMLNTITSLH